MTDEPIRTLDDVRRFESERPLGDRLPGPGVLDVFRAHAAVQPDRTALTMLMTGADDEEPRRVTYAGLLGLVQQAANAFHTLGGARAGVAFLLPNLVETHAVLWGAMTSGYVVPVNFLLRAEHVAALVEASGARVLVALGPHPALDIWATAMEVKRRLPDLVVLWVGAPPPEDGEDGVMGLAAALAAQPADRLVFDGPGSGDDVAAYMHTGGTTGNPRLVTLTHRSQLAAAVGGRALADVRPSDSLTATLPLFHAGGTIFCALAMFLAGAELVVFSPAALRNPAMVEGFWRLSAKYGATLVGAVPTGLAAVVQVPVGEADLSRVRAGFTGASPIPPSVREAFAAMSGQRLCEIYGMTESSGIIAVDPVAGSGAPGSVGIRLPYTQVSVRRLDGATSPGAGEECAPHEIGAVVVRGPHVSPGYRDPAHDAGVFEDGALITGDLGYQDEAGNLYIAGRVKDLIIRGGHNIDPLMIENAMCEHPDVAMAAAVGMPDDYAGEVPAVYVSLRPGADVTVEDLQEHARRTIGERPAWPRRIHVLDGLPLTAVGKIFKPTLREDVTRRVVDEVLAGVPGTDGADVRVAAGGPRGMRVEVRLPAAGPGAPPDRASAVEKALSGFLFEVRVVSG